jgi:hypothetical protein
VSALPERLGLDARVDHDVADGDDVGSCHLRPSIGENETP